MLLRVGAYILLRYTAGAELLVLQVQVILKVYYKYIITSGIYGEFNKMRTRTEDNYTVLLCSQSHTM